MTTTSRHVDSGLVAAARVLGALGAVAVLSTLTPIPNWAAALFDSAARLEPASAIVVLGSNIARDGTLDGASLRRAVHGMVLFNRGLAPRLLFLGLRLPGYPSEAAARAELARALGIPPAAILVEERARTTREEAERAAAVLRPPGARRILLVTAGSHMARARPLFERQGFVVLPAPVQELPTGADAPEDRFSLLRRTLGEAAAHVYYRAAGHL